MPKFVDLDAHYTATVRFLAEIRHLVLRRDQRVRLRFDQCKSISPDAGLVLAAEVDRCRRLRSRFGRQRLTGNYPKEPLVEQFLQDIGFFSHLAIRERRQKMGRLRTARRYIRIRSRMKTHGSLAEEFALLLFEHADTEQAFSNVRTEAVQQLYVGLTEAMTNVAQHAYPKNALNLPVLEGQWWMAAYIDREKKELRALLYDQGVGIPATLPLTKGEQLRQAFGMKTFGQVTDGDLIAAAVKLGRSQTQEEHRGKGMDQFRGILKRVSQGTLRILSRKGRYLYDEEGRERHGDHAHSLGGTLIEWRIRW